MTNSLEPSPFSSEPVSPRAPWRWRLENADGAEVTSAVAGQSTFPSQSDAESWLGEVWRDLVDDGVDAVTLLEGDRPVYGPMSLHP
jgi:hypothetical protein